MNITLLSTTVTTVPTAKGTTYQMADIAFKNNSFGGKVEGKKIMSFGAGKPAFEVLSVAQPGGNYEVNVVKNEKGYNDWVSVVPAGANSPAAPAGVSPVQGAGNRTAAPTSAPARTPYETPEERAQRQVYIIRQSSVSSSVAMLSANSKAPVKLEDVLTNAEKITNFVLGQKPDATGFDDFPDVPDTFFKEVNVI